jgi:4'-phosphopantetheinyl transferase
MNEIEVYFVGVDVSPGIIEALAAKLTAAERRRADSYRFDHDRRRSIVSRAATRQLLGRYLQADPHLLEIAEEEHGKPVLRGGEMHFNASHSGDLIALAFSKQSPVGVDVERHRTFRDAHALARRYFSPDEVAIVNAASDQGQAFLTIWTAKEAIVKATGKGIGASDLRSFSVPYAQSRLLPAVNGWGVAAIDVPLPCYYAAVACRVDGQEIVCRNIETISLL